MRKRKTVPALVLALAMVLALTAPAFAANPKSFEGYGLAVTVSDVVSEENGNVHAPANATVTITDEANAGFVDYLVCIASDGEDQEVGMRDLELNKAYTAADLNRMAQKESGGSKTFNRFTFMIGEMWGSGGSLEACYFCTVIFDGKATEPTKPAETAKPTGTENDFEIANGVLNKYKGSGGSVTIPDGVTRIQSAVFSNCQTLTDVSIPDSVVAIGGSAFYGCSNLTSVVIPSSVTIIENSAFGECTNLTSVTIPNSVTSIEYRTFYGCSSLTSVVIPSSVTRIEGSAFEGCKILTSVTIPNSVTSIAGSAFYGCSSLTSVTIPDSVTSIGAGVFYGCSSLTSVTIPDSVTSIGSMAFRDCNSLTNVTISNSVTNIENQAFMRCSGLTSMVIPSSVTSIGERAFCECSNLTSVTIPSSVTNIGALAFIGTGLKNVYYSGTEAQWKAIQIGDVNDPLTSATIHYNSPMPNDEAPIIADPTNDALKVDGVSQVPTAYKIGGANYFQLRDVAMLLNGTKGQFSVDYDAQKQAVVIVTGQPYKPLGTELAGAAQNSTEAIVGNNDVYINGEKADLEVYKIGGANYFKIRDLGKALGFNVGWTAEKGMFIESDKPYTDAD